jgi:hypothetical protein
LSGNVNVAPARSATIVLRTVPDFLFLVPIFIKLCTICAVTLMSSSFAHRARATLIWHIGKQRTRHRRSQSEPSSSLSLSTFTLCFLLFDINIIICIRQRRPARCTGICTCSGCVLCDVCDAEGIRLSLINCYRVPTFIINTCRHN